MSAQDVPGLGRAGEADQVADHAAGDRGGEAAIATGQAAGDVAAVAVAGDGQPVRDRRRPRRPAGRAARASPSRRPLPTLPTRRRRTPRRSRRCPRVDDQHRPTASGQFLVVEVDAVRGAVPGVVRAAVDVEQQRLRAGRCGVADHPALHGRSRRRSRSRATDAGTSSASARLAPCSVRTVSAPDGQVDDDQLTERRRGGEHDDGACRRRPTAPRRRGPRRPRPAPGRRREVEPVEVGAAAVADAEQHAVCVVDELGQRPWVAGAAGHDVAVEPGREVGSRRHRTPARGTARPSTSPGRLCRPRAAPRRRPSRWRWRRCRRRNRPAAGGRRARRASSTYMPARWSRSTSGAVAAANASRVLSGDQAGAPACQSPSVTWRTVPCRDVEDVDVHAHGAEEAGAVGLVVEPLADQRRARLGAVRVRGDVDGRGERDRGAVRATTPARPRRAEGW